MPVVVLGLSYRTAPIGLLERVAVPAGEAPKALASLVGREHIDEAVVLSTCNRVEVYASVYRYHGGVADLRNFFCDWAGIAPEDLVEHTYDRHEDSAAAHLFAVTSGLDSMVVGERQIHLQVREAFATAQDEGSARRVLNGLFRQALRVGKRTRAETAISDGAASVVDAGLAAAGRVLGDLDGRTVLVVGAGKIGGMAATRLRDLAGRVLITNRTPDKARALARRVGGEVLAFDGLARGLAVADLVLSSTGASQPLIDEPLVADVVDRRGGAPLVFVDLAVPRDVEAASAIHDGVTVLDIDAIREMTDTGQTGVALEEARGIVEEEARRFSAWRRSAEVEPTVAALRARAEGIRAAELARSEPKLSGLEAEQRAAVEAVTRRIVNTLLHDPTVRLKDVADSQGGTWYASAVRELFDLPDS